MKYCLSLAYILICSQIGFCQTNTIAGGGDGFGQGGTVNFSVGQLLIGNIYGWNGSADYGVSIPFEIYSITPVLDDELFEEIKLFPNPFSEILNLEIQSSKHKFMQYYLFDLLGRTIIVGEIHNSTTQIPFNNIQPGIYLLRFKAHHQFLKTIKIIKSK